MLQYKNTFIALVCGLAWLTSLASPGQAASCTSGVQFVTVELIDSAPVAGDNTARREHVFVSEDLMDMLAIDDDFTSGARVNPQIHVEIEKPTIDGRKSSAVFTVAGVIEDFPIRHIRVYRKSTASDKNSGEYKLFQDVGNDDVDLSVTFGNGGIFGVDARVNSIAVSQNRVTSAGVTTTRDFFCQAPENDEMGFTEHAFLSSDTRVAIVAPHGGGVEKPTDEQADQLAQELDTTYGIEPAVWWTDGSWGEEQTFQRWHTTASAIDPTSFPGLAKLFRLPHDAAGRPFRYTVALHGYGSGDVGLILGGRADRLDQCLVAKRIQEALVAAGRHAHDIGLRIHSIGHSDLTVANTAGKIPPNEHAGHLQDNLVNRLSPNPSSLAGFGGLQLEQSASLRDNQVLLDSVTHGLAQALDELVTLGTPADHCSSLN